MQPRSLYTAALSLVTLIAIPATTFAAGIVVPPGPTGKNNNTNYQKMAVIKQTLKFQQSKEATISGKKRLAALFGPITGGGSIVTLVGQDDKTHENIQDVEATINHLKEGDIVNLDLEQMYGQWNIKKAKIIELKEGEETPHGYVFKESYPDPSNPNAALIRVTKYDMSYEMVIPFVKDEKGQPQPDPDMVAAVQALKADQPVYVQTTPAGQKTLLAAIFPYKEPSTGKVTKVSDQAVDAGKTQAVDIETSDGKSVTVLVPGKVMAKKFVPDPILKNSVHALKPGANVSFLTHDDNGKSFLIEITKLPPTPKSSAAKPEKMEPAAK